MRKLRGFTLIELMVTLAVAAIVLGVAIPSFNQTMRNNSSSALGSELASALNYARSEAVKRGRSVSICASDDGANCLAAGNWDKGWLVFVDEAPTPAAPAVTVGELLRYWDRLNAGAVVSAVQIPSNTDVGFVRFGASGALARLADGEARRFTVRITDCEGNSATVINVGVAGMLSTTKQACP